MYSCGSLKEAQSTPRESGFYQGPPCFEPPLIHVLSSDQHCSAAFTWPGILPWGRCLLVASWPTSAACLKVSRLQCICFEWTVLLSAVKAQVRGPAWVGCESGLTEALNLSCHLLCPNKGDNLPLSGITTQLTCFT